MGLTDVYPPQPMQADPNEPTIQWGSPQAAQIFGGPKFGGNDLQAPEVQAALGRAVAAGAPVNFAQPAPADAGGAQQPSQPGGPINFAAIAAGVAPHVVPAHDVQLGADVAVQGEHAATADAIAAQNQLGAAQVGANENAAQVAAGRAGQYQAAGDATAKQSAETQDKEAKAIAELNKNSEVDPNHYMSTMSTGKRLLLSLSAGLMQAGMGLRGQSGPNPVLQQIEQETQRDVEAQKSKFAQKLSVFHQMREAGLDSEQALAATQKYYLNAGASALESSQIGAQSPVIDARKNQAVAALKMAAADKDARLYGRVQAQTVGGGGSDISAIRKRVQQIRDKAAENGKDIHPDEAWRQALEEMHPGSQQGDFQPYNKTDKTQAGSMRSAGVQAEHGRLLGRYDSAIDQIDQAINHLKSGYEYGGDEKWAGIRQNIASETGFLMHGGAAEGAVKGQLEHLGDLNQTSLGQKLRGHSTIEALEAIKQQLALKKQQEEAIGKGISEGQGFGGLTTTDQALQNAGATPR